MSDSMPAYRIKKARELDWDDLGFVIQPVGWGVPVLVHAITHEQELVHIISTRGTVSLSPEQYVRVEESA